MSSSVSLLVVCFSLTVMVVINSSLAQNNNRDDNDLLPVLISIGADDDHPNVERSTNQPWVHFSRFKNRNNWDIFLDDGHHLNNLIQ